MIRIWHRPSPYASYAELDLQDLCLNGLRLQFSYQSPHSMTFKVRRPQHTKPIPDRSEIIFVDDSFGDTFNTPTFIGHIIDVNPGEDSNEVLYLCYDPTRRALEDVTVMSHAWDQGAPPTEGLNSYPRIVFNATIDTDEDWAYCRAYNQTVEQILSTILTDAAEILRWHSAAPGASGSPFVASDLAAMTFKPQSKVVFESENIRNAVQKMLGYMPGHRFLFDSNTRTWRFHDVKLSPATTLILNDPNQNELVLTMQITRSWEGRATAVKFYGPQSTVVEIATTEGTSPTLLKQDPVTLETMPFDVVGYKKFQVADPTKWKMGRQLTTEVLQQLQQFYFILTRNPHLQVTYDGTVWEPVYSFELDTQNGVARTAQATYRYVNNPPPGSPHYIVPLHYKLVYPRFATPLSMRYPTSGYSGEAYTQMGLESTHRLYDESLAIGWENGVPVTSQARLDAFNVLAQKYHSIHSSMIYAGSVVLQGIRPLWRSLNRRVNLTSRDPNGVPLTTGWENLGMWVTEVEYDYENDFTTVSLSSDQMDLIGYDAEQQKQELKIKALTQEIIDLFSLGASGQRITWTYARAYRYSDELGNLEFSLPRTNL